MNKNKNDQIAALSSANVSGANLSASEKSQNTPNDRGTRRRSIDEKRRASMKATDPLSPVQIGSAIASAAAAVAAANSSSSGGGGGDNTGNSVVPTNVPIPQETRLSQVHTKCLY